MHIRSIIVCSIFKRKLYKYYDYPRVMTAYFFNVARKLTLCALLFAEPVSLGFNSQSVKPEQKFGELTTLAASSNLDKKVDITSVTNLIANVHGDPVTLNGIKNALKGKVPYHAVYSNLNDAASNLPEAYAKSTSELLIICGHHFTGTFTFFDHGRESFFDIRRLGPFIAGQPSNPYTKILITRACHTVQNPEYLMKESQKYPQYFYTAEDFIKAVTTFAPNVELIIGNETRAPFTNDRSIQYVLENYSIAETQGLKAYGEYARTLCPKLFKDTGHEKDSLGNFTYSNYYDLKWDGERFAYYIKEADCWRIHWTYYSIDHPEGMDVIVDSDKTPSKTLYTLTK
jgi:hypothetical protein